ncbi:bacteriophage antitermination protein Q [Escherichia coli]|nr:antiterminator [Escherichia coli]EFN9895587.1 antiterminator [Escherichia coli]EIP3824909.1 antiterminator [Escherichia coli]MBB9251279.1 antiterminator [Escherichia coli]HDX5585324.1 antiterminator [Escherichia coli]
MNTQFLEYVRQQLMVATADLSGATKGQLMAWLENAQFDTGTFKRKKPRVLDEVTGEMITLDNPPIPGKQSHTKGSHIPLVQLGAKKVAGKTMERLKKLVWLAAQDVKAELAGRETYEYQALASLVGVTPKNWSETFTDRWVEMRSIFLRLDSGALLQVTRSRSQQKATNLDSSLAKLD